MRIERRDDADLGRALRALEELTEALRDIPVPLDPAGVERNLGDHVLYLHIDAISRFLRSEVHRRDVRRPPRIWLDPDDTHDAAIIERFNTSPNPAERSELARELNQAAAEPTWVRPGTAYDPAASPNVLRVPAAEIEGMTMAEAVERIQEQGDQVSRGGILIIPTELSAWKTGMAQAEVDQDQFEERLLKAMRDPILPVADTHEIRPQPLPPPPHVEPVEPGWRTPDPVEPIPEPELSPTYEAEPPADPTGVDSLERYESPGDQA